MEANARFNLGYIWTICVVAALGGLLFGYDWVVIGGAKPFYEAYFNLARPWLVGLAMSSALIGCIAGSILSGILSDPFGRKKLLIVSAGLFTIAAIGTGYADTFFWFVTFRVIGGIGIGLASNLSPMYIAEVSPSRMRGRFVSVNQLTIVVGILLAQLTNLFIAKPSPTADQLRLIADPQGAAQVISTEAYVQKQQEAKEKVDEQLLAQAIEQIAQDEASVGQEASILPLTYYEVAKEDKEAKKAKDDADGLLMRSYLRSTWNGQTGWRWMFWAQTVPALLFFFAMMAVPESPRWLVKNGREEQAGRILGKIGGDEYGRDVLREVEHSLENETKKVNYRELLDPRMMKILGLGIFLAVFQQWCGINVIFNYAQEIFTQAGYSIDDMLTNIVITGVINMVFTFVAIKTVDQWGRRILMLVGAAGLSVVYLLIGGAYHFNALGLPVLVLVVVAIGTYAMSLAPITWVVISEIFPNRIRGAAMAISVTSLWIACAILTETFPILNDWLGPDGTFWTYAGICVVGFIVLYKRLPETKGKSLEELEVELVGTAGGEGVRRETVTRSS